MPLYALGSLWESGGVSDGAEPTNNNTYVGIIANVLKTLARRDDTLALRLLTSRLADNEVMIGQMVFDAQVSACL